MNVPYVFATRGPVDRKQPSRDVANIVRSLNAPRRRDPDVAVIAVGFLSTVVKRTPDDGPDDDDSKATSTTLAKPCAIYSTASLLLSAGCGRHIEEP